jgi:hypothetical protein
MRLIKMLGGFTCYATEMERALAESIMYPIYRCTIGIYVLCVKYEDEYMNTERRGVRGGKRPGPSHTMTEPQSERVSPHSNIGGQEQV